MAQVAVLDDGQPVLDERDAALAKNVAVNADRIFALRRGEEADIVRQLLIVGDHSVDSTGAEILLQAVDMAADRVVVCLARLREHVADIERPRSAFLHCLLDLRNDNMWAYGSQK